MNIDKSIREKYEEFFKEITDKEYICNDKNNNSPRRFKTPKIFANKIIDYFVAREENRDPIFLEDLLLHLGVSRTLWQQYSTNTIIEFGEDFALTCRISKKITEVWMIKGMFDPKWFNVCKFILKCKYNNWVETERQIVETHTVNLTLDNKKLNSEVEKEVEKETEE